MAYEHELVIDDSRLKLRFEILNTSDGFYPAHWHNHLEILFVLKDSMSVWLNDRKFELSLHDLFIVNSREIHSTQFHGTPGYVLLQIPLSDLERLIPGFDMIYFREYHPAKDRDASDKVLEELLLKMTAEFEKKEDGYQILFTALIYEFVYELYTKHSVRLTEDVKSKAQKNAERIVLIMDYVKAHYTEPISLEEISAELSICPEYFCRLFKKYTAQTFLEYVNTVRMMHFYSDLMHTSDSITYLMDKNGITNYKVFIRMFRKAYGTTPNKVRSRH